MASQNQQECYSEDVRCCNITLNSINFVPNNCLNINQPTNDNEKCDKGEASRKRSFMEMETGEEEKRRSLDLNLRLTPLGLHQKDDISSNQYSEISSTSSCMPHNLDSSSSEEVEFSNTTFGEYPSLILMGCSRCLIYVMVSEINPKCPSCHSSILIDIFRSSFGKKSRNC
ncbi:hypothetical protein CRYUN_Cryun05aG0134800 [Craigia yunnanensis]